VTLPTRVRFTASAPGGDRVHHLTEDDVRTVLGRLPDHLWSRLRAVHFNDRGIRPWRQRFGYANPRSGEIAMCAQPPRMALTRCLRSALTPEHFGAECNRRAPELALRRFLLYDVFLHELGHLQRLPGPTRSKRLTYPREKLAEAFSVKWRQWLWSQPFDHPDPVHQPPEAADISTPIQLV
jgi:hypothetical protein